LRLLQELNKEPAEPAAPAEQSKDKTPVMKLQIDTEQEPHLVFNGKPISTEEELQAFIEELKDQVQQFPDLEVRLEGNLRGQKEMIQIGEILESAGVRQIMLPPGLDPQKKYRTVDDLLRELRMNLRKNSLKQIGV